MTPLDGNLYQQYQEYGVVGPIDVLTRDEAFDCLTDVVGWIDRFDGSPLGDNRLEPHLHLPFINRIVRNPKLVKLVQSILQTENILCWSSDFNVKKPKSQGIYSPHQDATYTGLRTSCPLPHSMGGAQRSSGNKRGLFGILPGIT
jgi:hypothetical protein